MNWKFKWDNKAAAGYLRKRGLYIFIGLCIVALAATAIFTDAFGSSDDGAELNWATELPYEEMGSDLEQFEQMGVYNSDAVIEVVDANSQAIDKTESDDAKTVSSDPLPVEVEDVLSFPDDFEQPLQGDIILGFSMDELIYSKTLNEWRTHAGLDIAAGIGSPVSACLDGVVTSIIRDARMGIVLTIDHEDGWLSRYVGLSELSLPAEGDDVIAAQIIGEVGDTAIFESLSEPHLHFELYWHDKPVDPIEYLE